MRKGKKTFPLRITKFITGITLQPSVSLRRFLPVSGYLLLLGIFTISASAEKPSPPPSWAARLEKQRESLKRFETEVETWRFDVRNATSSVTFEEGDSFLKAIPHLLSRFQESGEDSDETVAHLAKEIRDR